MANDDSIAGEEIMRQIAAMRTQVGGSRGVMAYLDRDKRTDVNKTFLASTIRSATSHNQRQEEEKCWTLRRMEQQLNESRRRQSRSRSRNRSRSRSSRDRRRFYTSKRRRSSSRSRSPSRRGKRRQETTSAGELLKREKDDNDDERSYWARKKAEKTSKMWEHLHSQGTVSVENAPDFSSEDFDDDDDDKPTNTNPLSSPKRHKKQYKQHKKQHVRKKEKHKKTRQSRS